MMKWTSRPYENLDDLEQMHDLLMAGRRQTDDWRYWHVGELAFNFFMVDCHLDLRGHIRLWYDAEGKLVGYAILGEDPSFDFQVLPEWAWAEAYHLVGIEAQAMAWADTRLVELRQKDAQRWSGDLVSTSRQDDSRRIAFLQAHGFRYCGEFPEVNMLRSLEDAIPQPVVPTGFQVRTVADPAGQNGAAEITNRAAAQRLVWLPWTVGNVSDEDYVRFMQMPGYDRQLDVVTVTPSGVIAAYVNGWLDPVNRIGDLGPVGALPEYRRQGLTRAALLESLRRMQALGMERVCISTGVSNLPAIRLYESIGFTIVNKTLDFVRKVEKPL